MPVTFESVTEYLRLRHPTASCRLICSALDQANMPGTGEYPNGRRRWPPTLEELATDERLQRIALGLGTWGRASTRADAD